MLIPSCSSPPVVYVTPSSRTSSAPMWFCPTASPSPWWESPSWPSSVSPSPRSDWTRCLLPWTCWVWDWFSDLVILKLLCFSGRPEDPLRRSPWPGGERQVPRGVDQGQVRPVRCPRSWDERLPEQDHPRDCQPKVERGFWGGSSAGSAYPDFMFWDLGLLAVL